MSGYISVTDSEENEKSYIFWNFSDGRLLIQNGADLILPLTQQSKSNEEIRNTIKNEVSSQILLNSLGGRIGIGTEDPKYTLDVNGDLGISGSLIMKKISDYDSPQEYFIEPGADISGSLKGSIGIGTKTPSEKITIKSINNLAVTPNIFEKSTIRFENWNKTSTEETINKSYSMGLIDSKFTLLDSTGAVVFSIDEELFTLNKKFFISELTVDKITINQNISYKSIVVDDDFSTDILTANTGTITELNSQTGTITNFNSQTGTITNFNSQTSTITDCTITNLEITSSVILPTLTNINMSNKTTTKDLDVTNIANIKQLFVNQKEIKIENLGSKFDSILDTLETDECLDTYELYPLNTKCIASSLGSFSTTTTVSIIEENQLWTGRNSIKFNSITNLPIKNMNKEFSFEFYSRFDTTNLYRDEPILTIQKENDVYFKCSVIFVNSTDKIKLRFETSTQNYIEIISNSITAKPLNEWRHFKVSIDMINDIFKFYLDGEEQTSVARSGSFISYDILEDEKFYFKTGDDLIFTDLLFIPEFNVSLEHFNNNRPWSSSNILIGKNSSFHLDSNGNFWAKKVW